MGDDIRRNENGDRGRIDCRDFRRQGDDFRCNESCVGDDFRRNENGNRGRIGPRDFR